MKKVFLLLSFILCSQFVFSQQKALVGDAKAEVRNLPDASGSKVLYQLKAGDEIKVYSASGDKSFSNGVANYWYKISNEKDEWINAESVYTFPTDFVSLVFDGPGDERFDRIVFKDFKKENGELYFLVDYVDNYYRSGGHKNVWVSASEFDWIGNRSKNAEAFIDCYTSLYNEEYLNENKNIFTKENITSRVINYKLKNDNDIIVFSNQMTWDSFYLFKAEFNSKNKSYPYGIKIGMRKDKVLEKLGGYDYENSGEQWIKYHRENAYDLIFYFKNDKVTKIVIHEGWL
ncbi:MAG: hypothetical protein IK024_13535 [Treponema sp.]|nr:hypothetical protein [Treponema sp.]